MKKRINIKDMRTLLRTEAVVETVKHFVYPDEGKYGSGLTFVSNKELFLMSNGKPENPFRPTDGDSEDEKALKINFGAKSFGFLFGKLDGWNFWLTDPRDASHLFVEARWESRGNGCSEEQAKAQAKAKLVYFSRARSNGGGSVINYWIISLWDKSSPLKCAEALVKKYQDMLQKQRDRSDGILRATLEAEEKSRKNKDIFMPRLLAVQQQRRTLQEAGLSCKPLVFGETYFAEEGSFEHLYVEEDVRREEEIVGKQVDNLDQTVRAKAEALRKYAPLFLDNDMLFRRLGGRIEGVQRWGGEWTISVQERPGVERRFALTAEGYAEFQETLKKVREQVSAMDKAEAEIRERVLAGAYDREEEEARKAAGKEARAIAEAKAAGCPSDFRFKFRKYGATGNSMAFVVTPEGKFRMPDENETDNPYKRSNPDYLTEEDGTQVWNQIFPGEIVVGYKKADRRGSIRLQTIWGGDLTEKQEMALGTLLIYLTEERYANEDHDLVEEGTYEPLTWWPGF